MITFCYIHKDKNDKSVELIKYLYMILLPYAIVRRPYIIYIVCVCAHFQVNPKKLRPMIVKRILKYLVGITPIFGYIN